MGGYGLSTSSSASAESGAQSTTGAMYDGTTFDQVIATNPNDNSAIAPLTSFFDPTAGLDGGVVSNVKSNLLLYGILGAVAVIGFILIKKL